MVPLDMFEALIAVREVALPEIFVKVPVVPVTTLPVKEPLASRRTIVEAPLAEAAEVLALSKVPEEILEALMAVKAIPLPDTESAVIAPAAKAPPASRRTIVAEPLAEAAVVLALSIVPEEILEALILVIAEPLAVIMLAEKDALASRKTIVFALIVESAVVNALPIVPLVILEALILVSEAPLPEMLAFIVPFTVTLLAKVAF
jgi:hypothetical protein